MASTLNEFRAQLARRGVSWHDIGTSNPSEVDGYFERMMPDGSLRRAPFHLYDRDAPVGDYLERFVIRALLLDQDESAN